LQDFHISKGVKFHLGVKLVKLTGDGVVNGVVLSDGTTLPADLVILGTGINPNVEFVGDVGRSNGGIETDVFLRTKYHNVWAAGDVARYQLNNNV
jgi:3-phenylpropionate/trans-cinnamate dioxygenase ferredoxin reductase subunit